MAPIQHQDAQRRRHGGGLPNHQFRRNAGRSLHRAQPARCRGLLRALFRHPLRSHYRLHGRSVRQHRFERPARLGILGLLELSYGELDVGSAPARFAFALRGYAHLTRAQLWLPGRVFTAQARRGPAPARDRKNPRLPKWRAKRTCTVSTSGQAQQKSSSAWARRGSGGKLFRRPRSAPSSVPTAR